MPNYKIANIIKNERISYNIIRLIITNPFIKSQFTVSSFHFIEKTKGEIIKRPYTPIKVTENTIEFRIKIYEKGNLTKYLEKEKKEIKISEPILKLEYINNKYSNIIMIAGGTGITPMYQILQYVSKFSNENITNFTLFFCNKTINDIFLVNELNKIKTILNNKLNIIHIIESCNDNINNYEKGFIRKSILEKYLINLKDKLIYVCGPPAFMNVVSGDKTINKEQGELNGILKEMGFCKNDVYKF